MTMTVLQVGYPLAPVGPDAVGGAEQVLALCDRAVVAAGHRSIVIAPEGSITTGELIALPPVPDELTDDDVARARRACATAIDEILDEVDLVHMHGVDFWTYLPVAGPPVLATLHLPPSFYPAGVLPPDRPDTWLVAVSERQRRAFAPELPLLRIDNGVDLDRFRPDDEVGDYVLALGRLCPEKGYDLALDAARAADLPMVLAGRLFGYDTHRRWFDAEIRPRLDDRRRFVGPVAGDDKRRLLAKARCVVIPSQVPETSSLVAMEALACGTPVVAWDSGALPEVVDDGVTGLLVRSADELPEALTDVIRLDRGACRRAADRFASARAAERHVELYEALARRRGPAAEIERIDDLDRLLALPWDDLHLRCPDAGPFLRRGWLVPWIEAFGADLRCLALWRGDRLDALLPLHIYDEVLVPIGAGVSDRHDALAAGTDPFGDVARLVAAIEQIEGWRTCELPALRSGSPLGLAPVRASIGDRLDRYEVSPTLTLPADDPWGRVPKRLRGNLRTARNRAAREHEVAWCTADDDRLEGCLDALIALHTARWSRRGEDGVLADDPVQRHLRAASRRLLVDGVLRLHVLRLDGEPAAAVLGLLDRGRLHYYIGGFDPRFRHVSPGTLAIAHALDEAAAEGATELDMLRGAEPYKYAWGAVDRPLYRRVLAR